MISSRSNITLTRIDTYYRAVARSENPEGHVILGGDNVPPLVEIGLTDLPKTWGVRPAHPSPLVCDSPE